MKKIKADWAITRISKMIIWLSDETVYRYEKYRKAQEVLHEDGRDELVTLLLTWVNEEADIETRQVLNKIVKIIQDIKIDPSPYLKDIL